MAVDCAHTKKGYRSQNNQTLDKYPHRFLKYRHLAHKKIQMKKPCLFSPDKASL